LSQGSRDADLTAGRAVISRRRFERRREVNRPEIRSATVGQGRQTGNDAPNPSPDATKPRSDCSSPGLSGWARRDSNPGPLPCHGLGTRRRGQLANPARCKHNASVPNVLIRDLPPEVHASLQRRAEAAGQSLQQYLTTELSRVAQSPTIAEVLERIAERSGGRVGLQTAVDDLHDERARR